MFTFKKTRLLREAQVLGVTPPSVGLQILIFLLVFFLASMAQGMVLFPAQVIAVVTSDAFVSVMQNTAMGFGDKTSAILEIMSTQPSWIMAVQLFTTAVPIVFCLVYCRKFEKRSYVSLGFAKRDASLEYLAGMGIGFAMLSLPVLFCVLTGQADLQMVSASQVPWGMIILFFIAFLVQGLSEEIMCRSFLLVSLSRGCNLWVCILTNALLFASLHIFNPGITPLALLNLTLFGIFASIYMLRRGSIWGIAAIHSLWNFAQGNIYGVAVSGMENNPSLMLWQHEEGMSWLNGGNFGVEGGLAVTVVLVIAILFILMTPTKRSECI